MSGLHLDSSKIPTKTQYTGTRRESKRNKAADKINRIDNAAGTIFPLFENRTCMPAASPNGSCTLGAIPIYMVNVSSVAQIQLAINFARNANLRLTIKNKGHDVNGKSYGAGSLGIYTNWLRDIRFIPSYSRGNYSGPAYKVGTGVEVEMLYREADSRNLSVVGGICKVKR